MNTKNQRKILTCFMTAVNCFYLSNSFSMDEMNTRNKKLKIITENGKEIIDLISESESETSSKEKRKEKILVLKYKNKVMKKVELKRERPLSKSPELLESPSDSNSDAILLDGFPIPTEIRSLPKRKAKAKIAPNFYAEQNGGSFVSIIKSERKKAAFSLDNMEVEVDNQGSLLLNSLIVQDEINESFNNIQAFSNDYKQVPFENIQQAINLLEINFKKYSQKQFYQVFKDLILLLLDVSAAANQSNENLVAMAQVFYIIEEIIPFVEDGEKALLFNDLGRYRYYFQKNMNMTEAIRLYFAPAASLKNISALILLGNFYLEINEFDLAIKYYLEIIAQSELLNNSNDKHFLFKAHENLGNIYQNEKKNYEKALFHFTQLYNLGNHFQGGAYLGDLIRSGLIITNKGETKTERLESAVFYYKKSAAAGNPIAYDTLAYLYYYESALFHLRDFNQAKEFYKKAIEIYNALTPEEIEEYSQDCKDDMSSSQSYFNLAELLLNEIKFENFDQEMYFEALKYLEIAAKNFNYDALLKLGSIYAGGSKFHQYGPKIDNHKAFKLLIKAQEISTTADAELNYWLAIAKFKILDHEVDKLIADYSNNQRSLEEFAMKFLYNVYEDIKNNLNVFLKNASSFNEESSGFQGNFNAQEIRILDSELQNRINSLYPFVKKLERTILELFLKDAVNFKLVSPKDNILDEKYLNLLNYFLNRGDYLFNYAVQRANSQEIESILKFKIDCLDNLRKKLANKKNSKGELIIPVQKTATNTNEIDPSAYFKEMEELKNNLKIKRIELRSGKTTVESFEKMVDDLYNKTLKYLDAMDKYNRNRLNLTPILTATPNKKGNNVQLNEPEQEMHDEDLNIMLSLWNWTKETNNKNVQDKIKRNNYLQDRCHEILKKYIGISEKSKTFFRFNENLASLKNLLELMSVFSSNELSSLHKFCLNGLRIFELNESNFTGDNFKYVNYFLKNMESIFSGYIIKGFEYYKVESSLVKEIHEKILYLNYMIGENSYKYYNKYHDKIPSQGRKEFLQSVHVNLSKVLEMNRLFKIGDQTNLMRAQAMRSAIEVLLKQ